MTKRNEPVRHEFNDNFAGRMRACAEAAQRIHFEWTLAAATWEPHDWDEF
jgi:hypothetical protein